MTPKSLPPGQFEVEGFPRFGTHLHRPAPDIPDEPAIEVTGAVGPAFSVPLALLASLPRVERTADFHCVSGWSATGLRWGGVAFATFYRTLVEPRLAPGTDVTHLRCRGLDGYRSLVTLEDALQDDVLLADHLDGRPLDTDHGAPVRLVSPAQYGFVSTKHLNGVELLAEAPGAESYGHLPLLDRLALRWGLVVHPRARVWQEERHGYLPPWAVRGFYRHVLFPPIRWLCARGSTLSRHDD